MPDIAVIDYGVGNLLSVRRGFEHCGARVTVTGDPGAIRAARRVVLPGVGAFANAMAELRRRGLDEVVHDVAARGTPFLGICLGMQMLLDESEEFGPTPGLGLIAGKVTPVPATTAAGQPQKIPHIGWNILVPSSADTDWRHTPMADVLPGEAAYFVHSFMASPANASDRLADCHYGQQPISAAIGRNNVFGCQFHPEKSGSVGLKILKSFMSL